MIIGQLIFMNELKMRYLKKYEKIIPFFGIIICLTAMFTPTAYFENIIWNHQIINWIWGLYQDTFNSTITGGFYEDLQQFVPSFIASSIILSSLLIISIGLIKIKYDLNRGKIKLHIIIIPAICVICSTIFWMVMMEIAEQEIYDISMWNRYVPGFGLIGLFTGASLIIIWSIITKFIKNPSN